jgi:uncharacterized protein YjbJ (UPF0337 family)
MDNQEIKGKGKLIKGEIREGVGKLTGNRKEQLKGKIEQAEGKGREQVGKLVRESKDSASGGSDGERLLKDLEEEFKPITDILDEGALRLGAELDKLDSKYSKRREVAEAKKRQ